ncbi:response regulator [Paenibacillus sp. GCM10027626]|uniref:response regulator transcription factor n=1 Tax=Paenibacillus sp. GCM10027626 TaxID=3273411 RepID=UPI00363891B7
MKLWILDDDLIIVESLQRLIARNGLPFDIITMSSASEALTRLGEEKPNVVLTDIQMPGMNGLELLARLQAELPDCPFILMSGFREFEYAQQALRLGVSEYLLKPIQETQLVTVLTQAVHKVNRSREMFCSLLASGVWKDEMLSKLPIFRDKAASHRFRMTLFTASDEQSIFEGLLDWSREQGCWAVAFSEKWVVVEWEESRIADRIAAMRSDFMAGMSDWVTGCAKLPKAWSQAEQALQTLQFQGTVGVRSYNELERRFQPIMQNREGLFDEPETSASEHRYLIAKAKKFVLASLHDELTLDLVASHVNVNRTYFSTLFKRETNQTFWDYVTSERIEAAKKLLLNESLSAYHIGEKVGYKNPSHFSRVFKERVGMTPNEYKNRFQTIE